MDLNRFLSYFRILFDLYSNKKVLIKWNRDATGFSSSVDLESELKRVDSSFSEEEFLEVVFEALTLIKLAALGKETRGEPEKIEAIRDTFLKDRKEKEFIYIQCSTNVNTIEALDYEILTKRKQSEPLYISTYSSLINFKFRDPDLNESEASKKVVVEISRKEIEAMIEGLQGVLKDINELERRENGRYD